MGYQARFTVSLSEASTETVTVDFSTVDGTAVAGVDYTARTGTLAFAAGETEKDLIVAILADPDADADKSFAVELSNPVNGSVSGADTGQCVISTADVATATYLERFRTVHTALHNTSNGYFGPQSGALAFKVPRHIPSTDSMIINEAPDYGGETVSETASFWLGLEAWNIYVSKEEGSATVAPYTNAWTQIDKYYVPSTQNQINDTYNPSAPAAFIPEKSLPSLYPPAGDANAAVGVDPFADELEATYGNLDVYLWHWIFDVEGEYGFYDGEGKTTIVPINTYERGMQESSFETITHPCWDDWENGGGEYGYAAYFTQGSQLYPTATDEYSMKWAYTCAPDAEARGLQWHWHAIKFAAEAGLSVAPQTVLAKKTADYLRYAFCDKYFAKIGGNGMEAGSDWNMLHYLVSWYVSWGGGIPTADSGGESYWTYRIGSSECHHGYQSPITAWAYCTDGGGLAPLSPTASDAWMVSAYRQLEMIRWLQSPEGPIAGGVSNSWYGQYATPTDGREDYTFNGMYYTYSPVWHDPASNNWVGFQAWGHGRTADLYLETAESTDTFSSDLNNECEIILDKLVGWFMDNITLDDVTGSFEVPVNLSWVSTTQVVGQTTNTPNLEGVYEFIPSSSWDSENATPAQYAAFWDSSTVPNPNLHCTVSETGLDVGVASSAAYMFIAYAQAKRLQGKYTDIITNSTHTAEDVMLMAKEMLDRMWNINWDGVGITKDEEQGGINRMGDEVYVPSNYASGTMPNGEALSVGHKFYEARTFLQSDPKWAEVLAYINGTGSAPVFQYHRFWAQCEYAISCAALHRHFNDVL